MTDSGVYTRQQLHALEFRDSNIASAVRSGDLDRLRPGWYASRNHDRRVAAAVRDGGVSTCVDALRFHGLWVPPGHHRIHLRRSRNLRGKHPVCTPWKGPIRTTPNAVDPPPIALKYAARCLPADEWVAACDSYLNSTGADAYDLEQQMAPTGATLQRMLAQSDARSQSGTESMSRLKLRSAGFSVVVQPRIEGVGFADLRIGRLIIECDSKLRHSSAADYERDHHRDRRALVDGWLVMRLTYDDVLYGWESVLDDVLAVTRPDRHRARTPRLTELVQRSVRSVTSEGMFPS